MLDIALELLRELVSHSYKAYIVGGFVRNHILDIQSNDIDITTNATPKEIKQIFPDSCLPNEDYGSVIVILNGVKFEITTFRKEIEYADNRRPVEVQYIDDLYPDLLRRDFVINTLCMDVNGNIIDYLGGQNDINKRIIRTVGDAKEKFTEDALRILRAVRFATILNFELSKDVYDAILETKDLVKNLSYQRKKEELEKIFVSPNRDSGLRLIKSLGLDSILELKNIDKVIGTPVNSPIAVWSLLDVSDIYPFSKNEIDLIADIDSALLVNNLDPIYLYKYGLYVNSCAAAVKGIDLKNISETYDSLIIKSRDDIDIDSDYIMELLNKEPGKYIKDIYDDVEKEILYKRLDNNREVISRYILENYE